MSKGSVLQDVFVLLLEDEALINLSTVEVLQSLGCRVIGCQRVPDAMEAVQKELPDAAVLDVNLQANQTSYELAEWLHERRVPIIFLTGYSSDTLSERWRDHPVCEKPCHPDVLRELLIKTLGSGKDQVR